MALGTDLVPLELLPLAPYGSLSFLENLDGLFVLILS